MAARLPRVRRDRRDAGRDQPAHRHARRRRSARSTPSTRSMTTRSSATPTSPRCATSRRADPQEQMARERGVTYVKLDGTVGILGNGAGLVMSHARRRGGRGGEPANFLDVGGGAQADEIVTAMEVLLSDTKVRAVLFNVFGGITRCDEVARGILTALDQLDVAGADRRAPRRHERRRGPPAPGRCSAAERVRRGDDARRGASVSSSWRGRRLMAILVNAETRLVVQGITGREGSFHATRNRDYGTNVVAGVTPGKGGQDVNGIPVFDTVTEAVDAAGRQHGDGVRAAAVRRRRDLRGGRRRRRDGHLHHRGHPGPRHAPTSTPTCARAASRCSARTAPARSLPGSPTSASSRRRSSPAGRDRPRLALGHADLPDRHRCGPPLIINCQLCLSCSTMEVTGSSSSG